MPACRESARWETSCARPDKGNIEAINNTAARLRVVKTIRRARTTDTSKRLGGDHVVSGNEHGQRHSEHRPSRLGALQTGIPAVVLKNLLSDGQSQTDPVLFAITDEGLEELVPDRFRNTGTIIYHPDFDTMIVLPKLHFDISGIRRNELAGISQEVDQRPFDLFLLEPGLTTSLARNSDVGTMKFRMGLNGIACSLHGSFNGTEHFAKSFFGLREFKQRIHQVRHVIDRRTDFAVEVFAFIGVQTLIAEKLRIRHDCGQRVAQVVRYRTSGSSNGGKPFRHQQLLLGSLQIG